MKTRILLLACLFLWTSTAFSQVVTLSGEPEQHVQPQMEKHVEYALVYFTESRRFTNIVITHPDGTRESDLRQFRIKNKHIIGDYA
jgi:hypothetical protein